MKIVLILWEGFTVAVIVFGPVTVFLLRRRLKGVPGEAPPGFWLRFSALLCGLCIIGLIGGLLLSPYGFAWFVVAMAATLCGVAKIAPKVLTHEIKEEGSTRYLLYKPRRSSISNLD